MSDHQINDHLMNQNQKFHRLFTDLKVFLLKKILFRLVLQFSTNEQEFLYHQAPTKYHFRRILKQLTPQPFTKKFLTASMLQFYF
jgi:hypothetical protein